MISWTERFLLVLVAAAEAAAAVVEVIAVAVETAVLEVAAAATVDQVVTAVDTAEDHPRVVPLRRTTGVEVEEAAPDEITAHVRDLILLVSLNFNTLISNGNRLFPFLLFVLIRSLGGAGGGGLDDAVVVVAVGTSWM